MGKVPGLKQEDTSAYLVTSLLLKNSSVADLWKMETQGIMDPVETKSKEEMEKNAVEHFMKTVDRDEEGRYIVKLPWIEAKEIVQNNRSVAEQRCIRTSQKLKVEGKYTVYEAYFKEWLNEEVIEKVPKEEIGKSSYYLPHRGVYKKNSTTTVLWWEDYEKKKFEIFRHSRLVFGLTCSPFLLAAVLNYHLEETKEYFPDTSEKLKNSFYVDNCVTSVCDAEELSHFIQEAKQLLAMACFDLQGWEHTLEPGQIHLAEPTQVLGLLWKRNEDVLFCNLQNADFKPDEYTPRSILSTTQKVFDPLGILCPVTICLKIMIQELEVKNRLG
ncbi:integrase catalytic domain-containing protein [Trichonephila clavipes]|nr:integrase catalytic domain-containing protein [Trichonephila clavipes]